jgi:protein TonB
MDRKKSKKADLEWRKSTFFQLGIVISLSLVLMAFEFVRGNGSSDFVDIGLVETPTDIIIIQTKHDVELPKPKPSIFRTDFETVDNKKLLDDFRLTVEVEPEDEFEDYKSIIDEPEVLTAPDVPFVASEIMPEFPGGDQELMRFLKENLVYPKVAREIGISGKVIISFVVETDGSLSNVDVARSASPSLDEEAMRVVKMMPKWSPGKQRQKPVRVIYNLPVDFILR